MMVFVDTKYRPKKKQSQTSNPVYTKYTPPPFKTKSVALQPPRRNDHSNIPSVSAGAAYTAKKESIKYSGDKLIGISIIHKSCLAPIFSQEEAADVAHMRR